MWPFGVELSQSAATAQQQCSSGTDRTDATFIVRNIVSLFRPIFSTMNELWDATDIDNQRGLLGTRENSRAPTGGGKGRRKPRNVRSTYQPTMKNMYPDALRAKSCKINPPV